MADGLNLECECCGFTAPCHQFRRGYPEREFWFCEVCAGTSLSSSVGFPQLCNDQDLHRSLGWIANTILSRLDAIDARLEALEKHKA